MPKVKCEWITCRHNPDEAGICEHPGEIELIHEDGSIIDLEANNVNTTSMKEDLYDFIEGYAPEWLVCKQYEKKKEL
jgi:hypothetical protein